MQLHYTVSMMTGSLLNDDRVITHLSPDRIRRFSTGAVRHICPKIVYLFSYGQPRPLFTFCEGIELPHLCLETSENGAYDPESQICLRFFFNAPTYQAASSYF